MLYVVRHGETNMNRHNIMCGRTNATLLDSAKEKAAQLGKTLADIKFDAAFASPLIRTQDTLRLILSENPYKPEIQIDERIIERDMGDFEALNAYTEPLFNLRWRYDFDCTHYNIETIEEMKKRVGSFLSELKDKYAGKNVIIVTHGGVVRIIKLCYRIGTDLDDITNLTVDNLATLEFPL